MPLGQPDRQTDNYLKLRLSCPKEPRVGDVVATSDVAVQEVSETVSTERVFVQGRLYVELVIVRHDEGTANRLEVSWRQVPKDLHRIRLTLWLFTHLGLYFGEEPSCINWRM